MPQEAVSKRIARVSEMYFSNFPPTIRKNYAATSMFELGFGQAILFLGALLLISYAGGSPVYAQNSESESKAKTGNASTQSKAPPKAFDKPYGYYLNPLLDHIQASSDQRNKITVIVQNYRGSIDPLRQEYNVRQQDFLSNVVKGQSSAQIMEQQMRLSQMYEEITSHYCRMSLEVRRVLNPDQIVRYEEFKRKRGWTKSQGK